MNSILWFLLIGALAGWLAGNISTRLRIWIDRQHNRWCLRGIFWRIPLRFAWPVGYRSFGKFVDGYRWGFGFVGVNWLRSSGLIFKMDRKGLCFRWDLDRTFTGEFL